MAVRPRLDDPAALTALLDQLGAPAAVRSALAAKGFSSLSSLAFALADPSDPAQVKLFLKALLGLPDDDDSGFVSADASCVRRLLLEASSLAPARPANPSAAGPSLPSPGSSAASSKLQPADFTAKYRASSSLPSRHPPWSFSLCSSSMGRRLRLGGFLGASAPAWPTPRAGRSHASPGTIAISSASCSTPNPSRRPHRSTLTCRDRPSPSSAALCIFFLPRWRCLTLCIWPRSRNSTKDFLISPCTRPSILLSARLLCRRDRAVWASIFELTSDHAWSLPDALNT